MEVEFGLRVTGVGNNPINGNEVSLKLHTGVELEKLIESIKGMINRVVEFIEK